MHRSPDNVQNTQHKLGVSFSYLERKNLPQGDSNPDPPNHVQVKVDASIHWTIPISADNSSWKEVYIPSLWWSTVFKDDFFGFRVEKTIKPISNTLSRLVQAGERLRNLWTIDRAATDWTVWPYDSLPARKVSFHRSGKALTQHCLSLFSLF